MRHKTILILTIAALCLVSWAASGATTPATTKAVKGAVTIYKTSDATDAITIPGLLSYQGKLLDNNGDPVTDTTYAVQFRLYQDSTVGSNAFWAESRTIRTRAGLFSILLGATTAIDTFPQGGRCFLGMKVGDDPEMTPRIRIASTAYAYMAHKADSAAYASSAPLSRPIWPGISTAEIADYAVSMPKIDQAGAQNGQVIKWNGGAWAPADDNVGVAGEWSLRTTEPDILETRAYCGLTKGSAGYGDSLIGSWRSTHVNLGGECRTGTTGQNNGYCTVVNGWRNEAGGRGSFVGSGANNYATGNYSAIAGGLGNWATACSTVVAGGVGNHASGEAAAIGGGAGNTADNPFTTVAGGAANAAVARSATVGGGNDNRASGLWSTIGGGMSNLAGATDATVGGGTTNHADSMISTVAGGSANSASGWGATVGGGNWNRALGRCATVAGGRQDSAKGAFSGVLSGQYNRAGDALTDTGATIGGGWENSATEVLAFVGGGSSNRALGRNSVVSGGYNNEAGGFASVVAGGHTNTASESCAFVGGGYGNVAGANDAVVGGGNSNQALFPMSTVAGGHNNQALGDSATIGGGGGNTAEGWATVSGGVGNYADFGSTVGGGGYNTALHASAVAGGSQNAARGTCGAIPGGSGVVVLGSNTLAFGQAFTTSTSNAAIFNNGVGEFCMGIGVSNSDHILAIRQNTTLFEPIADAWTQYSSKRWKENIRPIDDPLDKVMNLSGVYFDWKATKKHDMGLIAEDVGRVVPEVVAYEANGVDARSIDYARLVALLIEGMKAQQGEIAQLRSELTKLGK